MKITHKDKEVQSPILRLLIVLLVVPLAIVRWAITGKWE